MSKNPEDRIDYRYTIPTIIIILLIVISVHNPKIIPGALNYLSQVIDSMSAPTTATSPEILIKDVTVRIIIPITDLSEDQINNPATLWRNLYFSATNKALQTYVDHLEKSGIYPEEYPQRIQINSIGLVDDNHNLEPFSNDQIAEILGYVVADSDSEPPEIIAPLTRKGIYFDFTVNTSGD